MVRYQKRYIHILAQVYTNRQGNFQRFKITNETRDPTNAHVYIRSAGAAIQLFNLPENSTPRGLEESNGLGRAIKIGKLNRTLE